MAIIVTGFCDKLLGGGEMSEGQKFDFLGTNPGQPQFIKLNCN